MIPFNSSGLNRAHHQNGILNTVANTTISGIRSPPGILFGQSVKFQSMFETIAASENTPLYEQILSSLEEMAKSTLKTVEFEYCSKGKTVLGLTRASAVVVELDGLNISPQKKSQTVSGMQAAVD